MIEILNVKKSEKGDVLGTCTVHIKPWGTVYHEVTVFQRGINRWISMPVRKYESNGETKYVKLFEMIDPSKDKRFRDEILAAVEEYILKYGDFIPKPIINEDAVDLF